MDDNLRVAEIVAHATKELIRADGDASVLLPEEIALLKETGCAIDQNGRLLVTEDWLEAFRRIYDGDPGLEFNKNAPRARPRGRVRGAPR